MSSATNGGVVHDAVVEARALIGTPLDRTRQYWNTEVTRDAVRQFCWGVGDDNPLFLDEAYARASDIGEHTAPGTFLFSIDSSIVFPGLAGRPTLHIGTNWSWNDRIRVGDSISAEVQYAECRPVTGRTGPLVLQIGDATYRNQDGTVLGTARSTCARVPGANDNEGFNYAPREAKYTTDEIERIRRSALCESPRGAVPRFWDDVEPGDGAGPLVKGPLSLVDMMCWYAGAGLHGRRAHRIGWKELAANREHWRQSSSGAFEHVGQGHIETDGARKWGMPGPYDNGLQRTSWLAHLVTDWMGDTGFLKQLECRVRRPNVFGDVTWLTGAVASRSIDADGDHVVALSLTGRNQLDEVTTTGHAVVRLPTRS